MIVKRILGSILRIVTILYLLFALLYGTIFISVDLTRTINYQTIADAQAGRVIQVLIATPYILLGAMLLLVIIFYYVSKIKKININVLLTYSIVVTLMSLALCVAFIVITIITKERSLILVIVPAFCLLLYGLYLISNYKKQSKTENIPIQQAYPYNEKRE